MKWLSLALGKPIEAIVRKDIRELQCCNGLQHSEITHTHFFAFSREHHSAAIRSIFECTVFRPQLSIENQIWITVLLNSPKSFLMRPSLATPSIVVE